MFAAVAVLGASHVSAADTTPDYLVLGDSISSGYGLASPKTQAFANVIANKMSYSVINKSAEGVTSGDLLAQLKTGSLNSAIKDAEYITITCGGNDMMEALYQAILTEHNRNYGTNYNSEDIKKALNGTHPTLTVNDLLNTAVNVAITFVNNPKFTAALSAFEKNMYGSSGVIKYIKSQNPDAKIIIPTQYNPYKSFTDIYSLVAVSLQNGLNKLNPIIENNAKSSGYIVSDVFAAFDASSEVLSNATIQPKINLDFHPNAKGHALIADTIIATIKANCTSHLFVDNKCVYCKSIHTHSYKWVSDGNYHMKKCSCGDIIEKGEHTQKTAATCTSAARCSVCNLKYGATDKSNHVDIKYVAVDNGIEIRCKESKCNTLLGSFDMKLPTNLTYDGRPKEVSVSLSGGNLLTSDKKHIPTVVYTGELMNGLPVNAGNYTANITCGSVTSSVSFTIEKAVVTVMAEAKMVEQYYSLPTLTYRDSGFFGRDTFTKLPTVKVNTDNTDTVGEYEIMVEGAEVGNNYTVEYKSSSLSVTQHIIHKGGKADCMNLAVCEICNQSYGEKNSAMHVLDDAAQWQSDENEHWQICSCGEKVNLSAHAFDGLECTVCKREDPDMADDDVTSGDKDKQERPGDAGDNSDGNNNKMTTYFGIVVLVAAVASGIAVLVVSLVGKKKKY